MAHEHLHLSIKPPARLVAPEIVNAEMLIYRINAAMARAVFDGDILLEPECFTIDAERGELRLKRAPAFEIKVLVGVALG